MPSETPRDVAYLLSYAERRLGEWLAAQLAEEGCSVAEWRVLSFLADGHGHPMSEIADFAMLPAPTLTKLVDQMVAGNLLYRRPDDKDRRRCHRLPFRARPEPLRASRTRRRPGPGGPARGARR